MGGGGRRNGGGGGGGEARELVRRALRSGGEALRLTLLRHGCSAPPREAVRELLSLSGGGGGEDAEESSSSSSSKRGRGRKEREKGWSPDPSARLAEIGIV